MTAAHQATFPLFHVVEWALQQKSFDQQHILPKVLFTYTLVPAGPATYYHPVVGPPQFYLPARHAGDGSAPSFT